MKQQEMFGSALWLDAGCGGDPRSRIWILRGRFSVHGARKAALRMLGLGFFHCYINGRRV